VNIHSHSRDAALDPAAENPRVDDLEHHPQDHRGGDVRILLRDLADPHATAHHVAEYKIGIGQAWAEPLHVSVTGQEHVGEQVPVGLVNVAEVADHGLDLLLGGRFSRLDPV
jgi:hypothetical protein